MTFVLLLSCIILISPSFGANPFRLQMVSQGDDGAYDFAYDTGEGSYHIQSRDNQGAVVGKFAYIDPDGKLREIGYKADDQGFQPEGDIHPPRGGNTRLQKPNLKTPFPNNPKIQNSGVPTDSDSPEIQTPDIVGVVENDPINDFLMGPLVVPPKRPFADVVNSKRSNPDLPDANINPAIIDDPSNLEYISKSQVIGPVPGNVSAITNLSRNSARSQSISQRPSFPTAPLLSTGKLPAGLEGFTSRETIKKNQKPFVNSGFSKSDMFLPEVPFVIPEISFNQQETGFASRRFLNGNNNNNNRYDLSSVSSIPNPMVSLNFPVDGLSPHVEQFVPENLPTHFQNSRPLNADRKAPRNVGPTNSNPIAQFPTQSFSNERFISDGPFAKTYQTFGTVARTAAEAAEADETDTDRDRDRSTSTLNVNQSEKLKTVLEKLLNKMPTEKLIKTLENLATLNDKVSGSTSESAGLRRPSSPYSIPVDRSFQNPEDDSEQTNLKRSLFLVFHNLLEHANLTEILAQQREEKLENVPHPAIPKDESAALSFGETEDGSENEKFPESSGGDVVQSPFIGSPLYIPVEGVRDINGEKVLERTYLPFTRRYGYVYTQQTTQ